LKMTYAYDTLANLYRLWKRPVHIRTVLDDTVTVLSYDGSETTMEQSDEPWELDEEMVFEEVE